MAFIAVNAKADIITNGTSPSATTKKGKITPEQNAQINAWSLEKKTGILDTLDRCEADTSSPIDNKVTVTFHRGYLVIEGRLVEVEEGTQITIPLPQTGSENGVIVARFNPSATQESEFQVVTERQSSVGNINDLILYNYTTHSTNGVSLAERSESIYIKSMSSFFEDDISVHFKGEQNQPVVHKANYSNESNGCVIATQAIYASGDQTSPMRTIHQRFNIIENKLAELGFSEGSVSGINGATLTKMGKYAILTIPDEVRFSQTVGEATMSFTASSKTVHHLVADDYFKYHLVTMTIEKNKIKWTNAVGEVSGVSLGFEIQ